MAEQGGPAFKPIVIVGRWPHIFGLVLVLIAFLASGFLCLYAATQLGHADTWWASVAGVIGGCLAAALVLALPRWRRARREARRGMPDGPSALVDEIGATILDRQNNKSSVRWDEVVRLDHENGDWLVGPDGLHVAQVPEEMTSSTPNFAYAAAKARPGRFALVADGWAFTLVGEATDPIDPDRWLSARRAVNRLDTAVLVGFWAIVILAPLPGKADYYPLSLLLVLALWIVWLVVLHGRIENWLRRRDAAVRSPQPHR